MSAKYEIDVKQVNIYSSLLILFWIIIYNSEKDQ